MSKTRAAVYHNLRDGGAKRALYEIIRRLGDRISCDMYCPATAAPSAWDFRPWVREQHIIPLGPIQGAASLLLSLPRLNAVCKKSAQMIDAGGYDVVFVHHCQYTGSPLILKFLRTPTVYLAHEPLRKAHEPPICRPYSASVSMVRGRLLSAFFRFLGRIDRQAALGAAQIVANSYYSRETIYRAYGRFARVVYCGVDTTLFAPGCARDSGRVVLSVGALTPEKGHDFVIEAVSRIPIRIRPDVRIVAGVDHEKEKNYLQALARDRGVKVQINTSVTDQELVRLYQDASMTVCAQVMEPFGLVALESMACGTPVIAVREGGFRETVCHGESGLLCERDHDSLAQAIGYLLANQQLREYLGENGRQQVSRDWTWDRSASDVLSVLCSVAAAQ